MKIKRSELRRIIREEYKRLYESCPTSEADEDESHFGSQGAPADLANLSPKEAFDAGWSQAIKHLRNQLEKLIPSQRPTMAPDEENEHPGQSCDEAHPDMSHDGWAKRPSGKPGGG